MTEPKKKPTRAKSKKPRAKKKPAPKGVKKLLKAIPSREELSKILTEHPLGKKGVTMASEQYQKLRSGIMEAVHHLETPTYVEIVGFLKEKWGKSFSGPMPLYTKAVQLDLEARKLLKKLLTKPERFTKE